MHVLDTATIFHFLGQERAPTHPRSTFVVFIVTWSSNHKSQADAVDAAVTSRREGQPDVICCAALGWDLVGLRKLYIFYFSLSLSLYIYIHIYIYNIIYIYICDPSLLSCPAARTTSFEWIRSMLAKKKLTTLTRVERGLAYPLAEVLPYG